MADEVFGSGSPSGAEVERLRVEAIGDPGKRRFRLMVVIAGETHIVWMEKQQLQALGLAIEQLLEQIPENEILIDTTGDGLEFDQETTHQFRVGRIELGYDTRGGKVVISAYDLQQEDEDESATLLMRLSLHQSTELSTDAAMVVSAGRPLCPMCGQPMDRDGHVCPQQNGHLPISLDGNDVLEDL